MDIITRYIAAKRKYQGDEAANSTTLKKHNEKYMLTLPVKGGHLPAKLVTKQCLELLISDLERNCD